MITVRGCGFPPNLLYDVPNHIWYERLVDGSFRVGMTSVAVALAGDVLAFTPKRVGKPLEANRSCATIESGKWVGPARIAFDGEVLAVNAALIERPSLVNRDPYGAGWMILARASDEAPIGRLIPGSGIAAAYEAWMESENFPGCGGPPPLMPP